MGVDQSNHLCAPGLSSGWEGADGKKAVTLAQAPLPSSPGAPLVLFQESPRASARLDSPERIRTNNFDKYSG